jgi:periplasmic mercuric ion binding protein
MKTLKFFAATLFTVVLGLNTSAQTHDQMNMNLASTKTETFKVWGNCGMCKTRIEKISLAEGATTAVWETKTQILTVSFDPSKTSKDALAKKLASVGHDTENYKAPDDVYAKLPGCCHYERVK